jgi:thiol-disulfide isomerase/thioredoxin
MSWTSISAKAGWLWLMVFAILASVVAACRPSAHPTASTPRAGEGTLAIGARAPALDIDDWVHPGTVRPVAPLTAFEPGKIYVLEFWATWCQYSRAAVPLLASLQERYADDGVVVIGVAVDAPESLRGFLADADPDVRDLAALAGRYCLAVDPDGSVQTAFMDAISEQSLPTTFIVGRDGLIEWIGHPEDLENPLGRIVEGTWDRAAFADRWARLQSGPDAKVAEAAALLDRFAADHAADALALNEAAWVVVERSDYGPLPDAVLAAAERLAEQSISLAPTDGNHLDTLSHLLALRGNVTGAIETQRRAVAHGGADADRFRDYLTQLETAAAMPKPAPAE